MVLLLMRDEKPRRDERTKEKEGDNQGEGERERECNDCSGGVL
jgi:hypothetical protein